MLLFTASRAETWQRAKRELAQGHYVVSARSYISTIAYQGYGEGIDTDLILRTTRDYTDSEYMNPDHTIILDLSDHAERQKRIANRGALEVPDTFESRGQDFQDRVNAGYAAIASEFHYPIINANQSPEAIQAEIRRIIGV